MFILLKNNSNGNMATRESCSQLPRMFLWDVKAALVPVRDQGRCASCWGYSVTGMLSGRLKIYTNAAFQAQLSVQSVLSCFDNHMGCEVGGSPEDVYEWISVHGVPLETEYPYEQTHSLSISKCRKQLASDFRIRCCPNSIRELCAPNFRIGSSRHMHNIHNMQMELFRNGPIVGTVEVYQDFYDYKPGTVYTFTGINPVTNKYYGGHSCEIIGWNMLEEPYYWVIRTNWGKDWPGKGKGGIVHVRLGTNEVDIESRASSAIPLVPDEYMDRLQRVIPSRLYTLVE